MSHRLVTQSGAGSVSVAGVEYPVVDGVVEVAAEHADALLAHGFEYAPIAEEEEGQGESRAKKKNK